MPTAQLEPTLTPEAAASPEPTAFYLHSRGEALFAWLHPGRPGCGRAVVLCPPVGHEQVHSHRAWRHLAEAVAPAGFPVLRFDYHGTGDSAGTDEDPDRLATWRQNVRDAVAWVRRQLGCEHLTLVGLRLGAALAYLTAAEEPIDQLVLWAPVVSGRKYVRELRALSAAGAASFPAAPGGPGDIEPAGFVVTAQTAADLGGIDLLAARPRCERVLIVGRDDLPDDGRLRAHLTLTGIPNEQVAAPGYADMMAEPHHTRVPHAAIEVIANWLRTDDAGEIGPADVENQSTAVIDVADDGRVREQVCTIRAGRRLFGITSEPPRQAAEGRTWVVLLNAGSAYRVGPNRLYVELARALATQGFPCLRLDLAGIGDSPAADPSRENDCYPPTGFGDIDRALGYLERHRGASRVVLVGLCSGAYFAFQSAAQTASPLLVGAVAINPLTFFWKDGMSLEAPAANRLAEMHYYMTAAVRPGKWLKMLAGRSRLGLRGAARVLVERWRLARRWVGMPAPTRWAEGLPAHREQPDVPGDLARIVRRGRRLAFVFARSDPGPWILRVSARRLLARLRRAGYVHVRTIDDADHTFSCRASRRALVEAVSDHLRAAYSPAAPHNAPIRPAGDWLLSPP